MCWGVSFLFGCRGDTAGDKDAVLLRLIRIGKLARVAGGFVGDFNLLTAWPEELLFRGLLQNFWSALRRASLRGGDASMLFGFRILRIWDFRIGGT